LGEKRGGRDGGKEVRGGGGKMGIYGDEKYS